MEEHPEYHAVPPGGVEGMDGADPSPLSASTPPEDTVEPQDEAQAPAGPFSLPCGHMLPQRRSGAVWCGSCGRWWPIPPTEEEMAVFGQTEEIEDGERLPGQGPLAGVEHDGYRTA